MNKALVLDFDGVVGDSMPMQEDAWVQALNAEGNTVTKVQRDTLLDNFRSGGAGSRIFKKTGLSNDQCNRLRSCKDTYWESVRLTIDPVKGVQQAVRDISRVCHICMSTTAPRDYIEANLARFGIFDMFEHIITDQDVANPKPAPDALVEIAKRLDVHPVQLLMIGDTATDSQMASAAGCKFVGLSIHGDTSLPGDAIVRPNWSALKTDILDWISA